MGVTAWSITQIKKKSAFGGLSIPNRADYRKPDRVLATKFYGANRKNVDTNVVIVWECRSKTGATYASWMTLNGIGIFKFDPINTKLRLKSAASTSTYMLEEAVDKFAEQALKAT